MPNRKMYRARQAQRESKSKRVYLENFTPTYTPILKENRDSGVTKVVAARGGGKCLVQP